MLILNSRKESPVTKDHILREAEKTLFQKFVDRRIRTRFQLRAAIAGLGALGTALQHSDTYRVLDSILSGRWINA